MKSDDIRTYLWAGICLTGFSFVFINGNAEEGGRIFWHLLKAHDQAAAVWMAGILIAALLLAGNDRLARFPVAGFLDLLERQRYLVAFLLWIVLSIGTLVVYKNHPLAMDEYAALFQARIFAEGSIHGNFPPPWIDALVPRNFQGVFLIPDKLTGDVYSAYWPGYSLLLAPFVAIGAPWACNPALSALSLLVIARIARDTLDAPGAPGWAMLFALASPVFLINGISYYSMPAHLLLNLVFVWLLLVPTPLRSAGAGLVGGLALCLHNPLPHVAFALPWLIWLAANRRGRALAALACGYLPLFGLLGIAWVIGHANAPMAGIAMGDAPASTLAGRALASIDAIASFLRFPDADILLARTGGFVKLWLWASPLLLLLAFLGFWRTEQAPIRLLAYSALSTAVAYFAIRFDQGHGWGYRYFHGAWGVLPVLAALGVQRLTDRLGGGRGPAAVVMFVTLSGLAVLGALRSIQVEGFVSTHLLQRPPMQDTGPQVLVYRGNGYFGRDLVQNDPWLRGRTLSLLQPSRDVEEAAVRAALPGGYVVRQNRFGRGYSSPDPAGQPGPASTLGR
jgi:hypothetical protein